MQFSGSGMRFLQNMFLEELQPDTPYASVFFQLLKG